MNIRIFQQLEGARQAVGVTVIIDVFRAFTVECYLLNNGVGKLYPVGDKEIAYSYKDKHPDSVLIGERQGKILPGFDYGNSPSQIENIDFCGKTAIHTTSAGTQGIANAKGADIILGASLVNAKATAEYIKKLNAQDVSLVCMGLDAKEETAEDTLCALYIKSLLEDKPIELKEAIADLKNTSGAKFFDKAQQDVFPMADFALCTNPDIFPFALRYVKNDSEMGYMTKAV